MAHWLDELRAPLIVWLLLTLPVVCHHETSVAILNAVAAGHQHQHMLAEQSAAPPQALAVHQHGHGTASGGALATAPGLAAPLMPAAQQWRAAPTTPALDGMPASQGGPALLGAIALVAPPAAALLPRSAARLPLEGQRLAPPSPPPRVLPS